MLTSVRNPDSPRSHHMQRRATGSAQPDLVTETVPLPDEANTLSSDGASDPGGTVRPGRLGACVVVVVVVAMMILFNVDMFQLVIMR